MSQNGKRNRTLQAMVDRANRYLSQSPDDRTAERAMIHDFVCQMLMEANCYQGFNYLYWLSIGCTEWSEAGEPNFPEKDRYIYGPSGDRTRTVIY